ncbi:MAG: tetratricopeptide repeat protein [bacterium]
MAKHWAREQIKRNEIAILLEKFIALYQKNREMLIAGTGIGIILVVVAVYFIIQYRSLNVRAWDQLAQAQIMARSGQLEQSESKLKGIYQNFKRTPAAIHSLLFLGEIYLNLKDYQKAAEVYNELINTQQSNILLPFAYIGLGAALQDSGNLEKAIGIYETFGEKYSDHFLYPAVLQSASYCYEKLSMPEKARNNYEKIVTLYPQSMWAESSYSLLKLLDGNMNIPNTKETQ